MKAVQYFSDEHLDRCREMTTDQILQFLNDFQQLNTRQKTKTKLISIKVPEDLLGAFRTKADLANVPYQTQIKKLMQQWVLDDTGPKDLGSESSARVKGTSHRSDLHRP